MRTVHAVRQIRRMMGITQASLILCSDGNYYVIKFRGNPSGPDVLANELIGSLLMKAVGLPVPEPVFVNVSDQFLNQNPEVYFRESGLRVRPEDGVHFGSTFLGDLTGSGRPFEHLNTSQYRELSNGSAFVGVQLFDEVVRNQSFRQAVFCRDVMTGKLGASFIDHGSIFGGSAWRPSNAALPQHHRHSIIESRFRCQKMRAEWASILAKRLPEGLLASLSFLPREWYAGDISALGTFLDDSLRELPRLIDTPTSDREIFS